MDFNARIGTKIAALRKQHQLTQEQLAEKLDISIKHCSAVESGLSCLSLEELVEVSYLFDVTLDYLVKETPFQNKPFDCLCDDLPPSVINIMQSGNVKEIELLQEYLRMYVKLRNTTK